jgi:hypothetical protein
MQFNNASVGLFDTVETKGRYEAMYKLHPYQERLWGKGSHSHQITLAPFSAHDLAKRYQALVDTPGVFGPANAYTIKIE